GADIVAQGDQIVSDFNDQLDALDAGLQASLAEQGRPVGGGGYDADTSSEAYNAQLRALAGSLSDGTPADYFRPFYLADANDAATNAARALAGGGTVILSARPDAVTSLENELGVSFPDLHPESVFAGTPVNSAASPAFALRETAKDIIDLKKTVQTEWDPRGGVD